MSPLHNSNFRTAILMKTGRNSHRGEEGQTDDYFGGGEEVNNIIFKLLYHLLFAQHTRRFNTRSSACLSQYCASMFLWVTSSAV